MIKIPLSKTGKHKGKFFAIVDKDDEILAELNWGVSFSRKNTYARRTVICNGARINEALHQAVMENMLTRPLAEGEIVDHINGNGLDCRRQNLRVCSYGENLRNTRLRETSTTKLKGVSAKDGKYRAQIQVDGKKIHIGTFDTKEQAYEAYCQKALELHKGFANFG